MPEIHGVHHLALTVTDLPHSAAWYEDVLGLTKLTEFELPGEHPHPTVLFLHPGSELLIGLHGHPSNEGDNFSEFRTGLDHVAFGVADRADLEVWRLRLEEKGVAHSPIADAPYGAMLVFRDPDNIQLELYAPPPPS